MIKANELRLGNLVSIGHFDYHIRVVGILPNEIITIDGRHHDIGDILINPIQITPEILSGFIFDAHIEFFQSKKDSWLFWIDFGFVVYVQYVHQLQNLYYSLTGKELKINIKSC